MLKIFAVYDSKAGAFHTPMFMQTTPMAIRAFKAAAMDQGHEFHKFAEDFSLFELGDYDPLKAEFLTYEAPQNLGLAASFIINED